MNNIGIIYFNSASRTPIMKNAQNTKVINLHVYVDAEEVKENNLNVLYDLAAKNKSVPKTSQPATGEIYTEIIDMLEHYQDVLIMTPSTDLSGTHQNVVVSVDMLDEKVKKRVHIIQTRSFALSEMIITTRALELIDAGLSIDELIPQLNVLAKKITTFIFPGDLDFLRKSGRVNLGQLILGKMARLKLMIRHVEPTADVYQKARGQKMLFKLIDQEIKNNNIEEIYLGSLGVKPAVYEKVKEIVIENDIKLIDTDDASIIVGSHFGPNSFGLAMVLTENAIPNNQL